MAYNLQPLITILQGILDPAAEARWIVDENNPQLQSLYNKATSLQKLLDSKSSFTKLDSRIREVAHQAEDILESHMVDQMLSGSNCVRFTISTPDLQQVTRELDSVMEQAEKLMAMEDKMMPRELDSAMEQLKLVDKKMPSSSSSNSKSVVVGIDEDLMQLKDRLMLTCMEKKLEIVPIVGMGGVGKTTLSRKLYEDKLIAKHFPKRAWTTISQGYNMRLILKSLLYCITGQHCNQPDEELKVMLYQSLYNTKYLIVLDDIWSTKFWDEIRMYFPENNNGSRIVITTRESDVANYADSSRSQHQVQLLSESESWILLRQLVFGEEHCPPELQDIGRKIAGDCSGLPLAISVIGGLLSKMERSEDAWEKIGNNVKAAISESNGQCYSILSLSYNYLPNHMKPCFLYMGAFPEDYEIRGSRLLCMWIAEGFVKSNGERNLEEEGEDWLNSLVERNLFLVRKYKKNGKPKSYGMHDMLRDICIGKSAQEMFLNGPNKFTVSNPRRMRFHNSDELEDVYDSTESMSLTRSVMCVGFYTTKFPSGAFLVARLLRVLNLMDMCCDSFPTEIFELVNLRFLGVKFYSKIPRGISRLWNLQTLIAPTSIFDEPAELWKLSELRYLNVHGFEWLKDEERNYSVMKKLQRISFDIFEEEATTWDGFQKSIPNIKTLSVNDYLRTTPWAMDLSQLYKLESLRYRDIRSISSPDGFGRRFRVIFPCNIRKLVLEFCKMILGAWRTLCALHKLEVLTMDECSFKSEEETCDEEWELADGDVFCSLHFLSLRYCSLVRWIADETNFPRLCHLSVYDCRKLEEIPSGIGEISTLQFIELVDCSKSAVASAEKIVEEQSENGNDDLKLSIDGNSERSYKMNGKAYRYSMHDMLRDLCIKKYGEDMILNGPNKFTFSNPRRVNFHTKFESEVVNDSTESMSLTRSVLCIDFRSAEFPSGAVFAARLLRVLDLDLRMHWFPTEILELVNLRFLRVNLRFLRVNLRCIQRISRIPRGISRLWNLQTLIAPLCEFDEPGELWQLSELRYLNVYEIELLKDEEMKYSVLKKLQRISVTLYKEEATTLDGFLKSTPNIKKLSIKDDHLTPSTAIDLSHLHKLEILKCSWMRTISSPGGSDCRFRVIFPCNVSKLVLFFCVMNSRVWRTLCALHKLEVLVIDNCIFGSEDETCDEEWEATKGDELECTNEDEFETKEPCDIEWKLADGDVFCSLHFLYLGELNIVRWRADETNFPRLHHLCLCRCFDLEEIPSGIGEIPTLQIIELEDCTKSAVASAVRIVEEQSENGNDDLKLSIDGTYESEEESEDL